jgi:hypothetical protein
VYILEEAQQIGNSFPFAIGQYRVIDAVSRASYDGSLLAELLLGTRVGWVHTAAAGSKDLGTHVGEAHGSRSSGQRAFDGRCWGCNGCAGSCGQRRRRWVGNGQWRSAMKLIASGAMAGRRWVLTDDDDSEAVFVGTAPDWR